MDLQVVPGTPAHLLILDLKETVYQITVLSESCQVRLHSGARQGQQVCSKKRNQVRLVSRDDVLKLRTLRARLGFKGTDYSNAADTFVESERKRSR